MKKKERMKRKIKKGIIGMTVFIAFIILIGDPEELTFSNVLLRFASLFYIWIVAKANNYFYQG